MARDGPRPRRSLQLQLSRKNRCSIRSFPFQFRADVLQGQEALGPDLGLAAEIEKVVQSLHEGLSVLSTRAEVVAEQQTFHVEVDDSPHRFVKEYQELVKNDISFASIPGKVEEVRKMRGTGQPAFSSFCMT